MNITIGQPLWQTGLLFLLLPISIWLFRAVVLGMVPGVFTFVRTRRLFVTSFVPAAAILMIGVVGVAYGISGVIDRTTITDECLQIRKTRTPLFRQRWEDLKEVTEKDSVLRLTFLEGGRYKEEAFLFREQMGEAAYEALIQWLQTRQPRLIRREHSR